MRSKDRRQDGGKLPNWIVHVLAFRGNADLALEVVRGFHVGKLDLVNLL